jgi:hypothetical protein
MTNQNLKQRIDIVVEYLDEIEHPPMKGTVLELWTALEKAEAERDAAVEGIKRISVMDPDDYVYPHTIAKDIAESILAQLKMEEK